MVVADIVAVAAAEADAAEIVATAGLGGSALITKENGWLLRAGPIRFRPYFY